MHKTNQLSGRLDSSANSRLMRRLIDVGGAGRAASTGLSVFGYLCVCLNAILFGYLLVTDPPIYLALTKEDSWIENLTAIWLFLTGLLLVVTAFAERRIFLRCIYILGGIAFVFATGEEISWGQRIFEFETPSYLMNLNIQNEFNIHNIYAEPFLAIYIYGTFLFCITVCILFFLNKDTISGIPLPSIPLVLGFLVMLSHRANIGNGYIEIFTMEKELLLIFIVYTLFSRQIPLIIATTATMILVLILSYIYHYDGVHVQNAEIREYLFSFCCLFYSLELLLTQESVSRFFAAQNQRLSGRIICCSMPRFWEFLKITWLVVYLYVVISSIWLASLKYLNTRTDNVFSVIEETLQFLKDTDPIIISHFDVYLSKNRLIYVKDECGIEDINMRFFLHIDPIEQSDLPYLRKNYGFDNLDFHFKKSDGLFDAETKRCVVIRHLPSYGIANIRTGQYILGENRYIWRGLFTF